MSLPPEHIAERELVLLANGELSPERSAPARQHIESCSECQARLSSLEAALGAYFDAYHEDLDPQVPDAAAARRRLTQHLESATAARRNWPSYTPVNAAAAVAAVAACLAGIAFVQEFAAETTRFAPDSTLTPGITRSVTAAELCAKGVDESAVTVSRSEAMEVFQRHGIANPRAGAYELDYLIPLDLGGARDHRNLWPQPYHEEPWNAYAKDALEDRLRQLVCDGKLDLRVAQQDIANDWTLAYRKYFDTNEPLVSHAAFLRDTPWK